MDQVQARLIELENEVLELRTKLQECEEVADQNFQALWLVLHKAGGEVRLALEDLRNMPSIGQASISTWKDLSHMETVIQAHTLRRKSDPPGRDHG